MPNRVSHSLVSALRRVPGFRELDEPTLLELVGCSANLLWHDGTLVFDRGEPAEALYVVLGGSVRIVDGAGGDGDEVTSVDPGEYFGELSLLLDATHSKSAVARGETELLVVPRESFQDLLGRRPELEQRFRRRLEERVGLVTSSA